MVRVAPGPSRAVGCQPSRSVSVTSIDRAKTVGLVISMSTRPGSSRTRVPTSNPRMQAVMIANQSLPRIDRSWRRWPVPGALVVRCGHDRRRQRPNPGRAQVMLARGAHEVGVFMSNVSFANGWGPGPGAHARDSASAHAGRGSDQTGAKKGGARSTMECLRVRPTGSPRASRCRTSELRHVAANTVKMIGDSATGTEVFAGRSARCSSPGVLSTEMAASGWLTGWAGRTDASSELVGAAPSRQESGARGPTETAAAAAAASAATRAARRIRTTVQGYLSSRSWSLSGSADPADRPGPAAERAAPTSTCADQAVSWECGECQPHPAGWASALFLLAEDP